MITAAMNTNFTQKEARISTSSSREVLQPRQVENKRQTENEIGFASARLVPTMRQSLSVGPRQG